MLLGLFLVIGDLIEVSPSVWELRTWTMLSWSIRQLVNHGLTRLFQVQGIRHVSFLGSFLCLLSGLYCLLDGPLRLHRFFLLELEVTCKRKYCLLLSACSSRFLGFLFTSLRFRGSITNAFQFFNVLLMTGDR